MRPIPRSLLPDTLGVHVPVDGEYGGEYDPVLRIISHVRYDSSETLKRTQYVLEDGSQGLIYIDRVNSTGAFAIPVGSLVTVNDDEELSAVKVTPYKTFLGRVHHWEVEVA